MPDPFDNPFESFARDFLQGGLLLPDSIQGELAGAVADVFQQGYRNALPLISGDKKPTLEEFYSADYARTSNVARFTREAVLDTPINLTGVGQRVPRTSRDRNTGEVRPIPEGTQRAFRSGIDALRNAGTIRDAQQVLLRSTFGSIANLARGAVNANPNANPAEIVQSATLGVLDAIPTFERGKGTFTSFAVNRGFVQGKTIGQQEISAQRASQAEAAFRGLEIAAPSPDPTASDIRSRNVGILRDLAGRARQGGAPIPSGATTPRGNPVFVTPRQVARFENDPNFPYATQFNRLAQNVSANLPSSVTGRTGENVLGSNVVQAEAELLSNRVRRAGEQVELRRVVDRGTGLPVPRFSSTIPGQRVVGARFSRELGQPFDAPQLSQAARDLGATSRQVRGGQLVSPDRARLENLTLENVATGQRQRLSREQAIQQFRNRNLRISGFENRVIREPVDPDQVSGRRRPLTTTEAFERDRADVSGFVSQVESASRNLDPGQIVSARLRSAGQPTSGSQAALQRSAPGLAQRSRTLFGAGLGVVRGDIRERQQTRNQTISAVREGLGQGAVDYLRRIGATSIGRESTVVSTGSPSRPEQSGALLRTDEQIRSDILESFNQEISRRAPSSSQQFQTSEARRQSERQSFSLGNTLRDFPRSGFGSAIGRAVGVGRRALSTPAGRAVALGGLAIGASLVAGPLGAAGVGALAIGTALQPPPPPNFDEGFVGGSDPVSSPQGRRRGRRNPIPERLSDFQYHNLDYNVQESIRRSVLSGEEIPPEISRTLPERQSDRARLRSPIASPRRTSSGIDTPAPPPNFAPGSSLSSQVSQAAQRLQRQATPPPIQPPDHLAAGPGSPDDIRDRLSGGRTVNQVANDLRGVYSDLTRDQRRQLVSSVASSSQAPRGSPEATQQVSASSPAVNPAASNPFITSRTQPGFTPAQQAALVSSLPDYNPLTHGSLTELEQRFQRQRDIQQRLLQPDIQRNQRAQIAGGQASIPFNRSDVEAISTQITSATAARFRSANLGRPSINPATGAVSFPGAAGGGITESGVERGFGLFQQGLRQAISSPISGGGRDTVGTIRARLDNFIKDYVDNVAKQAEGRPDEASVRQAAARVKEVYSKFGNELQKRLETQFGQTGSNDRRFNAVTLNERQLRQAIQNDPALAQAVASQGGVAAVSRGQRSVLVGDTGSFLAGGVGGGRRFGGGGGGRGGGFGGGFGSLFAARFIAGGLRNLLIDQPLRQVQQFASVDTVTPTLFNDLQTRVGDTTAGIGTQFSEAQRTFSRGAFEQFGFLGQIPAAFNALPQGTQRSIARTAPGLGIAGGLFGLGVGAKLLGGLGIAGLGAAGSALAPLLFGGAAIAGIGALGLEGYNRITGNDVTLSSIGRGLSSSIGRGVGVTNFLREQGSGSLLDNAIAVAAGGGAALFDILGVGPGIDEFFERRTDGQQTVNDFIPDAVKRLSDQPTESSDALKLEDLAKEIAQVAGGSFEQYLEPLRQIGGRLGGITRGNNDAIARDIIVKGIRTGKSPTELLSQIDASAKRLGLTPGTSEYRDYAQEYTGFSQSEEFVAQQQAGRVASFGSGIAQNIPLPNAPQVGARLVQSFGINTSAQASSASGVLAAAASFGEEDSFVQNIAASQAQNPFQTGIITSLASRLAEGQTASFTDAFSAISDAGFDNQTLALLQRTLSRRPSQVLGALSFQSYQPGGDIANRFFNQVGAPIYQTSGADFLQFGLANASQGLSSAQQAFAGVPVDGTQFEQAAAFLGTTNAQDINAFLQGGIRERAALNRQRQYGFQQASFGVSFRQIQLREQFNEAIRPLQDRQIELSREQTLRGFEFNRERSELLNQFAIRREDIGRRRLDANQFFANELRGFDRDTQLLQRTFITGGGQFLGSRYFQDLQRNLQFGFQQEDFDEAIRSSTGRQRRRLIRQRERSTLLFNVQGSQIEEQRSQQDLLFQRQDERFEIQSEQIKTLQELDREAFDLAVEQREALFELDQNRQEELLEDFEERRKLEDEIRELQRRFQDDQIELQKEALSIQVAAAAEQQAFNEQLLKTQQAFQDITGEISQLVQFDSAQVILRALQQTLATASVTNPNGLVALIEMFEEINKLNTATIDDITENIQALAD